MKFKKLLYVVCVIIFCMAAVAVIWPGKATKDFKIPDFKSTLASDLDDWTWQDRPLAESPEMLKVIDETVRFDEAVYRTYHRGDLSVAIYVAYWLPGTVDIRDVEYHVPDNCWVNNGWRIDQGFDDYRLSLPDGKKLLVGKYRLMEKDGGKVHLAFWHLVGGKSLIIPWETASVFVYPKIIKQTGIESQQEQYFIRVSSTHPFEDLMKDPDFIEIIEGIANFGLWERTSGGSG